MFVPYTAKIEIEAKLQRLENANIISPVDTSKYATQIVVSKRDGQIRVCANYSSGLNSRTAYNKHSLRFI